MTSDPRLLKEVGDLNTAIATHHRFIMSWVGGDRHQNQASSLKQQTLSLKQQMPSLKQQTSSLKQQTLGF